MSVNINKVGDGKVVLISGGGKIYTDIAARFCHSEKDLEDIIASPYSKKIVKNILSSGHLAATEFDNFIFGVEGYSRVTEVQLVRKRLASYLIKSGRDDKNGKRRFDVTIPSSITDFKAPITLSANDLFVDMGLQTPLTDIYPSLADSVIYQPINSTTLLQIIESWYNIGVSMQVPEEDLRYLKPQATSFKAIIMMNTHSLIDWFRIRMCMNAQTEIRDLATKMYKLCLEAAPDLFEDSGPNCKVLGYCPENDRQNCNCKGKMITKDEALKILNTVRKP